MKTSSFLYSNFFEGYLYKKEDVVKDSEGDPNLDNKLYKRALIDYNKIKQFKKDSLKKLIAHFQSSSYQTELALLREIEFLMYYTFEVILEDFLFGKNKINSNIANLDEYIFTEYKENVIFKKNIYRLLILSCTNRFSKNPKHNLLYYYVFIEENGFDCSGVFSHFYHLLKKSNFHGFFEEKNYFKQNDDWFKNSKLFVEVDSFIRDYEKNPKKQFNIMEVQRYILKKTIAFEK